MSLELAAKKIRERQADDRRQAVDLAIVSNMVGDLAAMASRARDKLALAKSGDRQWAAALAHAKIINELAGMENKINRRSPVDRLPWRGALSTIAGLISEAHQSLLKHDLVMEQFGEFAGDPYKLALAIVAIDRNAKPRSKRTIKDGDRSWVGDALAESMKTSTPKATVGGARKKVATVDASIRRVVTKGANSLKVVATASGTGRDLENEAFSLGALKTMAAYYPGRLAFLNHSYSLPNDLFGVIEQATIVKRNGEHDLDVLIAVETKNPLAAQTLAYIKDGVKLGVSIGVIVRDSERQDDGSTLITEIQPLELSLVGIPALQTAWTQGASG